MNQPVLVQGCPMSTLIPGEVLQQRVTKSTSVFWEFLFTHFPLQCLINQRKSIIFQVLQGHRPWPELFNLMYFHDKSVQLCYRPRRNFVLWKRIPWDETQSELWAVWVCSLQFSHPINTTLKPWGLSHFFTDVVCSSGARGKDRALSCHFSFVIETEDSPSRRAFTKALVFYHPSNGHRVHKNWKTPGMQLRALIFSLHLLLTGMMLPEQIPSLNLVADSTGTPEAFCLPAFPHTWL